MATNSRAILFVHGFTGSPVSMLPWAEYAKLQGYEVCVPLLPGHGTTPADMNKSRWQQWYLAVETQYLRLRDSHEHVAVCALSMGGALALRLAALKPVAALALVNPLIERPLFERIAIPIVSKFLPYQRAVGNDIKKPNVNEQAYDKTPLRAADSMLKLLKDVQGRLSDVTAPLWLGHSPEDHVVNPANSLRILKEVGSSVAEEVILSNSFHVATLDFDAQLIFEDSMKFIDSHWP